MDGPNPTDRGKGGVKRSLLTEAQGIPVGLAVDHDMKLVRATVDSLPVPRPAPSPDQPQGMCLDKGYDFDEVRRTLDEFGFTAPSAGEEAKAIKSQSQERSHSWLNRFRRIMTLPLSRDQERWSQLQDSLALYRLAFGQPRQEDMLAALQRRGIASQPDQIADLRIDLRPPAASNSELNMEPMG